MLPACLSLQGVLELEISEKISKNVIISEKVWKKIIFNESSNLIVLSINQFND